MSKNMSIKVIFSDIKSTDIKIDGKYNTCTVRSVKQFQKAKKLKATGKVDYKTAKKLKLI